MSDSDLSATSYDHPPITEAVIGINFANPISDSDLGSALKKFRTIYPSYNAVKNLNVAVEIAKDDNKKPTANVNHHIGHRLSSADMTQILMLWPNSFTVISFS